ncbi:MAG: hypothetical protein AMJ54_11765 [Deltaproteobacteria bacterium SG8_13]|nr:MAG: hypothetical protein AMJ54_11765 [Deltaproteobacteria bacterium SG8_13]
MIPHYFPHTYLSQRVMQILAVVFDRVCVYLPSELDIPEQMQRWVDSKMLELRVPVTEDKDRLAAVLKAFRSWATLQGGSPGFDLDLLQAYHRTPPFIDAPPASQIRTDIGRRITSQPTGENKTTSESDRLLSARVFLSIAQQLDEQADALDRDYAAVGARQQDMLAELQDDRPDSPTAETPAAARADGHEQYMLAERMQAWAQLAAADAAQSGPDAPAVFVTASRQVLERLVDYLPEGAAIDRPGVLYVPAEHGAAMTDWRRAFLQTIIKLATGRHAPTQPAAELPAPPAAAAGQGRLCLEVIRIPHRSITELLTAAAGSQPAAGPTGTAAENTVVVAVESAGEIER